MIRAATLTVLLFIGCTVPRLADAQDKRTPEQLNALSGEAMKSARSGDMAKAAEIWTDILQEVPKETQLNIHFNLALAHRKLGHLPEAWHHVTTYVQKTGRKDKKAAKLLRKIEEGLDKGGYVKSAIVCIPEGATVLLGKQKGNQRVYPCPLTWWFKPGKHPVGARLDGHKLKTAMLEIHAHGGAAAHTLRLEKDVVAMGELVVEGAGRAVQVFLNGMLEGKVPFRRKLKPGDYELMVGKPGKMPWKKKVTIEVGKTVTETPAVAQAKPARIPEKAPVATGPTTISAAPDEKPRFKWEPWALVATGGALIVGGTIMQSIAYTRNEDLRSSYPEQPETYQQFLDNKTSYNSQFENDVRPLRTTSFVLYGVGGAAAVAGAVWLLLDGGSDARKPGALTLAPLVAPDCAGAFVTVGF